MALGRKTGGRRRGTPNRITAAWREAAIASGLTPLDYMLLVMRDESNPTELRLDAAARAAPFVHPRLAAVEVVRSPSEPTPEEAAEKRRLVEKIMAALQRKPEIEASANGVTTL